MSTQTLRSYRFYLPGRAQRRLSGASCLDLIQRQSALKLAGSEYPEQLCGEERVNVDCVRHDGFPGHLRQLALDIFNNGIKGIFGDPRWSQADV